MDLVLQYQDRHEDVKARTFKVYGGITSHVHFIRRNHSRLLDGGNAITPVGYRYAMDIDFMPIPSKEDSFWMQGFCIGHNRQIQLNGGDILNVTIDPEMLKYDFFDDVAFANGFRMSFNERGMRTITDDGSLRVFRPSYSPAHLAGSIVSGTFTKYVNLVDECSIDIHKQNLNFIDDQVDDLAFGFHHSFDIDFGVLSDSAQRQWLIEFCLWRNKKIDTTLLDSDNGNFYEVAFLDDSLQWTLDAGLDGALATKLNFKTKTLRIDPEVYVTAAESLILDDDIQGELDKFSLG